jgi:hypothetical protein
LRNSTLGDDAALEQRRGKRDRRSLVAEGALDGQDGGDGIEPGYDCALPVRIDHVIYGTSDLDAAARRVEAAVGIAAVAGGRHEGLGTHNQIVPLSDGTYIELLAVADPDEASRSPLGAALQAAIGAGRDCSVGRSRFATLTQSPIVLGRR